MVFTLALAAGWPLGLFLSGWLIRSEPGSSSGSVAVGHALRERRLAVHAAGTGVDPGAGVGAEFGRRALGALADALADRDNQRT